MASATDASVTATRAGRKARRRVEEREGRAVLEEALMEVLEEELGREHAVWVLSGQEVLAEWFRPFSQWEVERWSWIEREVLPQFLSTKQVDFVRQPCVWRPFRVLMGVLRCWWEGVEEGEVCRRLEVVWGGHERFRALPEYGVRGEYVSDGECESSVSSLDSYSEDAFGYEDAHGYASDAWDVYEGI